MESKITIHHSLCNADLRKKISLTERADIYTHLYNEVIHCSYEDIKGSSFLLPYGHIWPLVKLCKKVSVLLGQNMVLDDL